MDRRRAVRRNRRQRKTRYRGIRAGTLLPSQESRVCNIVTWVRRLMGLCPVHAISQELVRFDTQALENSDIESVQYQQGMLAGYEVREYVLLKWNHQCAYCDAREVPLELGFPRTGPKQAKRVKGFQAGDLVRAVVACGNKQGTYVGKLAVRVSGSFNITTKHGTIEGISHR